MEKEPGGRQNQCHFGVTAVLFSINLRYESTFSPIDNGKCYIMYSLSRFFSIFEADIYTHMVLIC